MAIGVLDNPGKSGKIFHLDKGDYCYSVFINVTFPVSGISHRKQGQAIKNA